MEARTGFDVATGVNDTGSGTSGTNINPNVMVMMWIQVIMRAYRHGEQTLN